MAKRTYNRRPTTAKKPVTSDKGRKQRVKGAETERRTGSKDRVTRGRGVTRTRTGAPRGASGPRTAPQQGPNRPSPRSLTIGGDTGRRGGANQPARSGPPRPNTPKTPGKFGPRRAGSLTTAAQAVGLEIASKLAQTAGKPGQPRMSKLGIQGPARPVAKPKEKKPMASMGSDYKAKERKLSRAAGAANFDAAFAKARRAGKKTFTWRGKRYNTKLKGE